MSRFKAVLRRQADDKVQTVRELNTDVARIIREQSSERRKERRAEVTQEERIHGQAGRHFVDNYVGTERDIILQQRGGGLERISDTHPAYNPLHFRLLFPHDELG